MEVRPGYKQTEVGAIPAEWETMALRDMNLDISDGNYSSKYPKASDFRVVGVPFVRANNIRNMTIVDDDMRFIAREQHQDLLKGHLKADDILITTRGEIGQLALVPDAHIGSNINAQLVRINSGNSGIDPKFLAYSIAATNSQEQLHNLETGSALKQLPVGRLVLLKLALPSPSEQRAIATALSDVDALLDGLTRLIAKKRDLKQATMQQLLAGQTRLPGFSGEWVERAIGQLAEVGRGRVISHREISKSTDPKYPVFSSQTSNNGVMGFLDTYDFEGEYVTWTTDGANAGTVFARSGRFNCTNVCGTIKPYAGDCRFIAAALSRVAKPHVSRHLGNPKLMNDVMKRIKIRIPASASEQTAIATILSDIDAELDALEIRLTKTRVLKQAMMSELLTGKTRLPTS